MHIMCVACMPRAQKCTTVHIICGRAVDMHKSTHHVRNEHIKCVKMHIMCITCISRASNCTTCAFGSYHMHNLHIHSIKNVEPHTVYYLSLFQHNLLISAQLTLPHELSLPQLICAYLSSV